MNYSDYLMDNNAITLIGTNQSPRLKVLFLIWERGKTSLINKLLENNCEVWHSKKNILSLDEKF